MNNITPLYPYAFTFAKDDKGDEIRFRFILTLSKKLSHKIGQEAVGDRLHKLIASIDGIEAVSFEVGRYSVDIAIARTFNAEQIITEIKNRLDSEVLSEIIVPKLA